MEEGASGPAYRLSLPETIVRLNLSGAEHITDQTAHLIAATCPELKHLDLERACNLTDSGLARIVKCCRKLESLNLNYVATLQSRAFSCIKDGRLPLRSLAIAGCVCVSEVSLVHVFQSCVTLESLDLSFCASVTDNVLLVLGKHCDQLQQLKLRGCHQVSDTGIHALVHAGRMNKIVLLDLARFDLQYKVTDLALLALAETCRRLETLILSGCAVITDVGMNWLASRCNALTDLDVSGCKTLTNHSLRVVGDNLSQLQHFDIRQCSRISDRGIESLSLNCPKLVSFHAEGLPLLSNALRCPVDAGHRHGIAALVGGSQALRHLDLSNCSAIGDSTVQCIATLCPHLATLYLSGCDRITSSGVNAIVTHCTHLTTLDVNGCTRVTDHAFLGRFQAVSLQFTGPTLDTNGSAKYLVVLGLRGIKISDAALEWISIHSPRLRELNVSDCRDLTDRGLLALSNLMELQRLWLGNVVEITATGLSWLAAKCTNLMLLDVRGCVKIHAFSLQSLASAWKFAVYTNNDRFQGMTPLPRAKDWVIIEDYGSRWRAARRIQGMYRRRTARQRARQKQEEYRRVWRIIRLQRIFRARQVRKEAIRMRLERSKTTEAARRVQLAYRKLNERREAARECARQQADEKRRAAHMIQAAWRKKQVAQRLWNRSECRIAYETALRQAVSRIQRVWRRRLERMRTTRRKSAQRAREDEEGKAAIRLQSRFRVRAARRVANCRRAEGKQEEDRRERAARALQLQLRRFKRRKDAWLIRAEALKTNQAACRVQTLWRAKVNDRVATILVRKQLKERERDAALRLQALWKQRKARMEVHWRRRALDVQRDQLVAAALKVQTTWRRRYGRLQVYFRTQVALANRARLVTKQQDAAIRLQAWFRGLRGREVYRQAQWTQKLRWNEVTRSDSGETFYYNCVTGEVRVRRPQDVLDLLVNPLCDNCETCTMSDATMECKDCGNMFCDGCWVQVHSGGRRKRHEFRALYDYDKRRVDYGDGEYPSCWSAEIEQDEIDGWSFRTHPRRRPNEVQGVWERYVDPDTRREWYYNRETSDHSYVPPTCFIVQSSKDTAVVAK